jgi:large subunit ribosomal protein L5
MAEKKSDKGEQPDGAGQAEAKPAAKAAAKPERKGGKKAAAKPEQKGDKKAEPAQQEKLDPNYVPRLLERYRTHAVPALQKRFRYSNPMQVPRVEKITLNVGMGEALTNARLLEAAVEELGQISGQKPVITKSRKAIANFRLRENQSIGCMVTLRRYRMYEFLDRLVNVALPRVRDFRGVSPSGFDGRGNFSLGIREQIIFPEVNYDKVEKAHGMNVTIGTTAKTDEEGRALLAELGMPFRT